MFTIVSLLSGLISCDNELTNPSGGNVSEFELINSYYSAAHLNILYPDYFSGDISYIVSAANLNITTEAEFTESSASKKGVTIIADSLRYNNYIDISSLSGGTTYYVYVLNKTNGMVRSLVQTTRTNPSYTTKTGLIGDGTATYTYTIYFPAGFGEDPLKKWPLIVAIKAPGIIPQNPNFPCIVFCVDASYQDWNRYQNFYANMKPTLETVIDDNTNLIDKNRLYIIGFSVGGCWAMDIANDDGSSDYNFAAVIGVGISSWLGQNEHCSNLGNTNIWLFYGANDISYGVNGTKVAYQTIPRTSGDHLLTEMPAVGHASSPVWASPYTFIWLLSK